MAAIRWLIRAAAFAVVMVASGCSLPPPPAPFDPRAQSAVTPDAFVGSMKAISDRLNDRVLKGQMTEAEAKKVLVNFAARISKDVKIQDVKAEEAWQFGDLFRTGQQWQGARVLLERAVAHAKETDNGDRRVNDSLRLAHVMMEMGDVLKGIDVTRSTFDVPGEGAAPILPATLLEIVPAGEKKGRDLELAALLEDAIDQHLRTVVDPNSQAGKAFQLARWHHIGNAWKKVIELYKRTGRKDLLREAELRAAKIMAKYQRV